MFKIKSLQNLTVLLSDVLDVSIYFHTSNTKKIHFNVSPLFLLQFVVLLSNFTFVYQNPEPRNFRQVLPDRSHKNVTTNCDDKMSLQNTTTNCYKLLQQKS